jgi:CheY-like chemotaxis protein
VTISVAAIPPSIEAHIVTDKQWLLENLLCLLSNAVKYSQGGTVDVRVSLVTDEHRALAKDADISDGACVRFEVWDTGIGLTESAKLSLFAPFQQAQRLAGGTGLGLFSLARRVEALHGDYGVSARPDGVPGSLFWFSIPYRTDIRRLRKGPRNGGQESRAFAYSMEGLTEEEQETYRRSVAGGIPKRVLVVDDAPSILKMTAMLLTKKGHVVEKAANGAVAVEMVSEALRRSPGGKYDVVLMDLQMPVLDGTEAIRRIRAAERARRVESEIGLVDLESGYVESFTPQTRRRQLIIALSANSDSETMQEAMRAGADHFMSKPFTYDTFLELVTKPGEDDEATVRG